MFQTLVELIVQQSGLHENQFTCVRRNGLVCGISVPFLLVEAYVYPDIVMC